MHARDKRTRICEGRARDLVANEERTSIVAKLLQRYDLVMNTCSADEVKSFKRPSMEPRSAFLYRQWESMGRLTLAW